LDEKHLTPHERARIVELYETRLATFGYDVRTVGWGSRADQSLRFGVLSREIDFNKKKILDVGCGFGDFVEFLDTRGFVDYSYVGVDISPKLIEEANKRFGAVDRIFKTLHLLDGAEIGMFDIVVCSGALSFRIEDNLGLAQKMLAKMFALCREAVCVNFLSSRVDYMLQKNFHFEPGAMLAQALSLSRWVRVYHDYPLYEFTLQILRNPGSYNRDRNEG
jgi:SAM-dependent methyltransferase